MALKEIALRMPNRPGQIARIARLLAEQKVNIASISLDSSGSRSNVRLITDRPDRALRILEDAGFTVDLHETIVVHLEDRAGSFLKVLEILAASRVNVESIAILVAREGSRILAAIATDDVRRARRVLEEAGFVSEKAERLITNADLVARSPAIPSESVGLLL
ncbi:MAG: ACT domain-containing protein [Thermoplasmata archaeon]|nr:ACT domain-containing protein [Thermoplasmata archaeon]MCI4356234.1 ACT domain-containing protein [Thermoplasmata archaeon]